MVGSFYDPELDEGCAFEELISFHGGIGGLQTRPFILHPAELEVPPGPIIGAASVHGILAGLAATASGRVERHRTGACRASGAGRSRRNKHALAPERLDEVVLEDRRDVVDHVRGRQRRERLHLHDVTREREPDDL